MEDKKIVPTFAEVDTVSNENCNSNKTTPNDKISIAKSAAFRNSEQAAEDELLLYIPFGRDNAIQAKELVQMTGYKDIRTLAQEIHRLRESGKLIISATDYPQGYFQPENRQEVIMFCRSMQSRINEIQKALRPAMEHLNEGGGIVGD